MFSWNKGCVYYIIYSMGSLEASKKITPPDYAAAQLCRKKWNLAAKPLGGLGLFEDAVCRIGAILGTADVVPDKKLLIVMCADNGVVEEGVSQSGSDVTKTVADNFYSGKTSACLMASYAGTDVWPVDIGVSADTLLENRKIARGTHNIAKGPAMSRDEALKAINTGIDLVKEAKEQGYKIIATGEMGIGNTTTGAAIASFMLGIPAEEAAGRGAGGSLAQVMNKQRVIKKAVEINRPDKNDPVDIVSKLGGFDIAGLFGVFIGGAVYKIPVVIDGFISSVAALLAARFDGLVKEYMLASHLSKEPAAGAVMDALGLKPSIDADMHLGEGTGALMFFALLDMALEIYHKLPSFDDTGIEQYKEYKD